MKNALLDRPWLLIIGGTLFSMGGWAVMIYLAFLNQPASISTEPSPTVQKAEP